MNREIVDNYAESVGYAAVFPIARRDILGAPNEDGPGGGARTPSVPRSLALDPIQPERTTYMVDETRTPSHKIRVHKDGGRWQVDYPCDCPDLNFRQHRVALTFATHHHCPPPWAPIPARRKRLTRTVR